VALKPVPVLILQRIQGLLFASAVIKWWKKRRPLLWRGTSETAGIAPVFVGYHYYSRETT